MKRTAFAVVCLFLFVSAGCGGGSSSTSTQVTVTVTPASATLIPNKTQQFTAKVSNTSNTAVTWAVNGTTGGSTTIGTITSSGLYTAPDTIPATPNVTVTATSGADATISAAASILIQAAISLVPTTTSVAAGQTVQFSATVNFSSNQSVNWQVNGVSGGNSSAGTIDSSGLYTAPSVFPVPSAVTVAAVSQADTTHKASAAVTITAPPLVISPATATLAGGAQQGFTASALSQSVSPVWSVSCPTSTAAACGSITASGLFTAPLSPPAGGVVTIHATINNGSAAPGTATVTVQVSDATLSGAYVFALSSPSLLSGAAQTGIITFDGNGNVVSGSLDLAGNNAGPAAITGGTYQVGTDGRGTATVQTAVGNSSWQIILANHARGLVSALDASGATLTGTLDLQQLPGTSTLQGNYTLALRGNIAGTAPQPFAMVGSLAANTSGSISSATLDFDNNFVAATSIPGSGTYTAFSASGRGTLTVTSSVATQSFAYYAVNANLLKLIEVDAARPATGELFTQPAGPFTGAKFKGRYALTMPGISAGAPFAMGGVFSLDGGVNIFNRVLDGVNQTVSDQEGAYFVTDSATGRTTITWDVNHGALLQYVAYPRSDGGFAILELDGSAVAEGTVLPQTITSAGLSTLAGGFALGLSGFEPPAVANTEGVTGQLTYAVGQTLNGTLDIVSSGASVSAAALQAAIISIDAGTGRGTAAVQAGSAALPGGFVVFYMLDSNTALVFESDGTRVMTGAMLRQF
jgi:hypothetical protein